MPAKPRHRIILTGGSGTLGRNLLELATQDESLELLCLLRSGSRALPDLPRCRIARVDFDDSKTIAAAIDEFHPTVFVHAAAAGMNYARPEWFDLIRFNVDASMNFCQAAARIPGCHFVYIGSGLAYRDQGKPLDESAPLDTLHPYGASKAAADILVRAAAVEFGVPMTVLRPFSFTGLWDDGTRLFSTLLRAAAEKKPMLLSPGGQRRDHCSARDIAAGILAAIEAASPEPGKPCVYNLGSGSTVTLREMIEDITAALGLKIDLQFGARPYSTFEPMWLVANASAAARDLGWRPRHNLAHAVWQLGRETFPDLSLREPQETIDGATGTLRHIAGL